jgi:DNA invertase Pin-like site-specific DNA recombinase
MRIGYCRVSTEDQTTALQIDALKEAGCEKIYQDRGVSGAVSKRPQLDRCLKALQAGDVLVVWKLDRLGRTLSHLLELAEQLRSRDIGFVSRSEAIDTTTPQGTLVFHLMGALAQFERSLIAERAAAGRAAAKKRGVRFGRPHALSAQQLDHVRKLVEGGKSPTEVAGLLGVSRATAYRALQRAGV